jgi:hypothetical protein
MGTESEWQASAWFQLKTTGMPQEKIEGDPHGGFKGASVVAVGRHRDRILSIAENCLRWKVAIV